MPRRPGAWARARLLYEVRAWSRRRWRDIASVIVATGVGCAAFWLLPLSAFLRGLAVGGLATLMAALLAAMIVVGSGELPRFWGIQGELATARIFQRRKRRRQGWIVVHGLRLGGDEIDHIAIGPGGVLVIETKWVGGPGWSVENGRLSGPLGDPLSQVRRNARRVESLLHGPTGGQLDVDVYAVVAVWGPGCPMVRDNDGDLQGVVIFSGQNIDQFERWLDEKRLPREACAQVQTALTMYADRQDRHDVTSKGKTIRK